MAKKRKLPPWRLRYELDNPVISARVPMSVHKAFLKLRQMTNKNAADIFREALGEQTINAEDPYRRGKEDGWAEASAKYQVKHPCSICHEEIVVETSAQKQAASRLLREAGWAHSKCADERSGS